MTTILLARHGETDWNRNLRVQGHSDTPLNENGRRQARALAESLTGEPIDAIYASDLARAHETASIVATSRELEVRLDLGLRERNFGSWEGLTRAEIDERFGTGGTHDGETNDEVRRRVVAAVDRIVAGHPDQTVLVVSHGGALNSLWHHASGARLERWPNCAVYRLEARSGNLTPID